MSRIIFQIPISRFKAVDSAMYNEIENDQAINSQKSKMLTEFNPKCCLLLHSGYSTKVYGLFKRTKLLINSDPTPS